ncbi:hypothetical protein ACERZ8_08860 [Tateyamaria armeniaca]|uniref:Uncharacterized protein n=1 Tax=Tateyamaria armeniaca TaxID=2518930 RepID=A0ABW8UXT6_9RHOB
MMYEPIPGQPQYATEEETMSVIRSVLIEAEAPKPSRKAIRAARADAAPRASDQLTDAPVTENPNDFKAFVERTLEGNPRRRADDLPDLQEIAEEVEEQPRTPRRGIALKAVFKPVARIMRTVRDFRPNTRHLALATLALLIVLRPHWFVVAGLMIAASTIGAFLILGSDRIWRGVLSYLARVDARDPERAARLRTRLDTFACRWDGILDFFPDGMVDGLYMPDFQDMQNGDAAHTSAMVERLTRMAHDA